MRVKRTNLHLAPSSPSTIIQSVTDFYPTTCIKQQQVGRTEPTKYDVGDRNTDVNVESSAPKRLSVFPSHDNGHQPLRQDVRFLTSIVAQSDDTGSFDVCLFYSGFIRCVLWNMCGYSFL